METDDMKIIITITKIYIKIKKEVLLVNGKFKIKVIFFHSFLQVCLFLPSNTAKYHHLQKLRSRTVFNNLKSKKIHRCYN